DGVWRVRRESERDESGLAAAKHRRLLARLLELPNGLALVRAESLLEDDAAQADFPERLHRRRARVARVRHRCDAGAHRLDRAALKRLGHYRQNPTRAVDFRHAPFSL